MTKSEDNFMHGNYLVVCIATDHQWQAGCSHIVQTVYVMYGRWLKLLQVRAMHKWHSKMLESQLMISA